MVYKPSLFLYVHTCIHSFSASIDTLEGNFHYCYLLSLLPAAIPNHDASAYRVMFKLLLVTHRLKVDRLFSCVISNHKKGMIV